ncbi:MAG TPA: hypothetical protein VFE39_13455 [Pseudonocardia sp.]|jgi:hypothetical protein|nr:hypothetical protein [Pseudonocardia sp.]
MPSVLVLGFGPQLVPGADGDGVLAVLDRELARFGEHDIDASVTLIAPDRTAETTVVAASAAQPWDVVVVGGGIRKPEPVLTLFEKLVNLIRQHAPQAAILFNTSPADTVEAALRWL